MVSEERGQRVGFVAGTLLAALDLSDTMVFPFLAEFFMAHGVSQSRVGLMFALLSMGIGVMVPCMGAITAKVGGPSRVLVLGSLLFCIVRVLTALLPFVPDGTPMLATSSVIFFITGCVYAFSEIGALSWVLLAAKPGEKVGAVAILVSSRAMGSMLGTPVGGVLFDLMGWSLTNIAGALILLVPLVMFSTDLSAAAPPLSTDGDPKRNALADPKYVIANLLNLIAQSGLYVIVPFMQPYFAAEFGTPKWEYGLITMFCLGVGFMGGSALSVELDKALGYRGAVLVGLVLFALGYLLIGPSPLLHEIAFLTEAGVWVAIGGLAVMLAGNSILMVLSPTVALQFAQAYGLSEEEATIQTSSLTVSIMALGLFFGPVSSSLLVEAVGVPWTNTIVGAAGAALGVAAIGALWLLDKCCQAKSGALM